MARKGVRKYMYKTRFGELVRGLGHNRGVPAGTLIGVECFMLFIATATALTGKNLDLLWAALYADDTSPLVKAGNIVEFQEALNFAMKWAEEQGCEFHLSGNKKPTFTAYLKRGQEYLASFDNLKLGDTLIERTDETTVLGLHRKVRPKDCLLGKDGTDCSGHSHGKLIDKYGYECEWDIGKLK